MTGWFFRAVAGVALAMLAANSLAGDVVDDAAELVGHGHAAQAYQLLAPLEFQRAGDVRFDYALGVAALESGQAAKATLAFERVIQTDPNHAGARLDMGRAYFQLGDDVRAEAEFESLKQLDPPPAAQLAIDKYLQAIAARARAKATQTGAYVLLGIGRDTNLNVATDRTKVFVPLFNSDLTLSDASTGKAANLLLTGAGADLYHAVNDELAYFAGADFRSRDYNNQYTYSFSTLTARGGVALGALRNQVRIGAQLDYLRQDHEANRHIGSASLEWRYLLNPADQLSSFAQYSLVRYQQDKLRINNANQGVIGGNWLHMSQDPHNCLVIASLFGGRENALEARADGDKRILGLSATGQTTPWANTDVWLTAGAQQGRYAQENILFATRRNDWQYDAGMGLIWRFSPAWSLRPAINVTHNRSNIQINDYRRTDYSISVQRDFR